MQLTSEQLRKSAVAALDAVGERGCNRCSTDLRFALGIGTVETMITAAFAALAQAQVDVPGDLVERMICAFCSYDADEHLTYNAELFRKMTAALRAALEDAEVAFREAHAKYLHSSVRELFDTVWLNGMLAWWRARLLQPTKVEERVTVDRVYEDEGESEDRLFCDGKEVCKADVLDYARSHLIAKLKAEGTVSREAGGNAQ